jgi:hypothetical protein
LFIRAEMAMTRETSSVYTHVCTKGKKVKTDHANRTPRETLK